MPAFDNVAQELTKENPLRIVHVFPDLLNLYGDGGNVKVLAARCAWRNIPAEVVTVRHGEAVDFGHADILFIGGGPDREQKLASEQIHAMRDQIAAFVEDNGAVLAICGGYQILGRTWLIGDEVEQGIAILGAETRRVPGAPRIIDNIVIDSPIATRPIIGFENHAGRTFLDKGVTPFGTILQKGLGNNEESHADGALYKNVIGSYLHGPLLGKNPEVADWLITRALERKLGHDVTLEPLNDSVEIAANDYMRERLGIRA